MPPTDLTGRWAGHYTQWGQEYPITADLVHAGDRLTGTMRDGETDHEFSVFQVAAEAGLPPGADEQIVARLRKMIPDAPAGDVRYVSKLPPAAVLEGRTAGATVSFVKTYQGESFGGYKVGESVVGVRLSGHSVHYEGTVAPDRGAIEGDWWINPEPGSSGRRTSGAFRLSRTPATTP